MVSPYKGGEGAGAVRPVLRCEAMGFMNPAVERTLISTVATASGKVTAVNTETGATMHTWAKARLWLLADRTAVVVSSVDGKTVQRATYEVLASSHDRRKREMLVVTSGLETLVASTAGCGCGMGIVGSAGPVEGQYRTARVRTPDWHVVT